MSSIPSAAIAGFALYLVAYIAGIWARQVFNTWRLRRQMRDAFTPMEADRDQG